MNDEGNALDRNTWPAALVAMVIVLVLGGIAITGIIRYSAGEALQIWSGLIAALGVVIGAIGTFFFTRDAVTTAQDEAARAVRATVIQEARADRAMQAFLQTAGNLDPAVWARLRETDAVVQTAVMPKKVGNVLDGH